MKKQRLSRSKKMILSSSLLALGIVVLSFSVFPPAKEVVDEPSVDKGKIQNQQTETSRTNSAPKTGARHLNAAALAELKNNDNPLPPEEERKFFAEVQDAFVNRLPGLLKADERAVILSGLNERGRRGVASIVRDLKRTPVNDEQVTDRFALIDYLAYRSKWDDKIDSDLENLILEPIPSDTPLRYKATLIGDKLEIFHTLMTLSMDKALNVLQRVDDPLFLPRAKVDAIAFVKADSDNNVQSQQLVATINAIGKQ